MDDGTALTDEIRIDGASGVTPVDHDGDPATGIGNGGSTITPESAV